MAARTPSQTVGPFFHEALRWRDGGQVSFAESGTRVRLSGRVTDGAGEPVGDAMIETWQLSPEGTPPRGNPGDTKPHGFGRVETAKDGTFTIETLLPGGDAPHLDVAIFARGLLKALRTRVYLAGDDAARRDPALAALARSPRVRTLIATATKPGEYRWDVRLQGEGETVFFAL
ncbi:MAG TPA: protocatechuate 3,4-dioxygenase subunit alpha [Usitatibacter sp.]|jgi:protocatechuate 3,4-dioxygenase alpha subunit|nr:protocatechuate 3,4-dioxygenase subunit alpha [Usitatibacter sp.]